MRPDAQTYSLLPPESDPPPEVFVWNSESVPKFVSSAASEFESANKSCSLVFATGLSDISWLFTMIDCTYQEGIEIRQASYFERQILVLVEEIFAPNFPVDGGLLWTRRALGHPEWGGKKPSTDDS